jgi:hypothetical protein
MYGLRRDGEIKATVKTQAAATGADNALIIGLFKLCWFILAVILLFFNFGANYCIIFCLCKKKVNYVN